MSQRLTSFGIALAGHDDDCLCTKCMMADLTHHVTSTRGEGAAVAINAIDDTPAVMFPREGGDDMIINGTVRSAKELAEMNRGRDNATYEGPKDLNYSRDFVPGTMIVKSDPQLPEFATAKKFGKKPGTRSGRGYVHGLTEGQTRLILSLLSTKDTTALAKNLINGWTLDPNEIDTISKQHARPFIDALLKCPNKTPRQLSRPTTPTYSAKKEIFGSSRQIEWLTKGLNGNPSLLSQKGFTTDKKIDLFSSLYDYNAKKMIDALMAMPNKETLIIKEEMNKAANDDEYFPSTIIPGYYRDNESNIWHVKFNQAGTHCYAMRQTGVRRGKASYEFISGGIKTLTPSMFVSLNPIDITLEEAKAYGRKTGTCYMCGRELTNATSIAEGIGPICAGKF